MLTYMYVYTGNGRAQKELLSCGR